MVLYLISRFQKIIDVIDLSVEFPYFSKPNYVCIYMNEWTNMCLKLNIYQQLENNGHNEAFHAFYTANGKHLFVSFHEANSLYHECTIALEILILPFWACIYQILASSATNIQNHLKQ